MSWTDDRISSLRAMWGAGHTASEIALQLGNVTRNAVIGKVHRLGLDGRPSPIKGPIRIKEKVEKKMGFLGLTDKMCKWPLGDPRQPDFHFCGEHTTSDLPYCQRTRGIGLPARPAACGRWRAARAALNTLTLKVRNVS